MGRKMKVLIGLVAGLFLAGIQSGVWAGEYTDKSYHDSDGTHTYKHPKQKSYTSPFDYGPRSTPSVKRMPTPAGCNCFTFDGTKSFDPDKQKLSFAWDFGDGQTSDQPVVNHCFEKAGDFTVTLTVKDSSGMVCDNGITTVKVSPNFPAVAEAGDDIRACVGESTSFDASGSSASGSPSYKWDFGDGQTGEGKRVSHAYEKAGNYRVLLTVDDGKATECSVAQDSLTASISDRVSVTLGGADSTCIGRNVAFNATATGGASKYSWDFGDGSTWEGGSSASHVYQKPGSYTVRVTADNGKGDSCSVDSATHNIKVSANPIADAGENLACCVGESTSFDGSGSSHPGGLPLSHHWDFGDGSTGEGARVNHSYDKSGTYRVVLTVKDDSGSECDSSTDSFTAVVNTKPEAVIEVR